MLSTLQGADDLAVSNVVGSNIFNLLVVLGCSALILPALATPVRLFMLLGVIPVVLLLLAWQCYRYWHLSRRFSTGS